MSETKAKIGFWGHFGVKTKNADGQTVRTNVIYDLVSRKYGKENLIKINTFNWKSKPIRFFLRTVKMFFKSKKIVILPSSSGNGLKIIVPLLNLLSKFSKRELYYVVIGGYLDEFLNENPKYVKILRKYNGIFVQTNGLMNLLIQKEFNNLHLLTNIKLISKTSKPYNYYKGENIELCTLSRVTKTKGIIEAINAVKIANEKIGNKIKLDVYGIIDREFEIEFLELVRRNKHFVEYKGVVPSDKTVEHLSVYFALLFPTYYHGEGFPGSVLDSFFAGTPIIATDWLYNSEIIKNNINGYLVPIKNEKKIAEIILKLYYDREKAESISRNNLLESKKFSEENVMADFYRLLNI